MGWLYGSRSPGRGFLPVRRRQHFPFAGLLAVAADLCILCFPRGQQPDAQHLNSKNPGIVIGSPVHDAPGRYVRVAHDVQDDFLPQAVVSQIKRVFPVSRRDRPIEQFCRVDDDLERGGFHVRGPPGLEPHEQPLGRLSRVDRNHQPGAAVRPSERLLKSVVFLIGETRLLYSRNAFTAQRDVDKRSRSFPGAARTTIPQREAERGGKASRTTQTFSDPRRASSPWPARGGDACRDRRNEHGLAAP